MKKNVKVIVADYQLPLKNIVTFSKNLPNYYMDTKYPYDDTYIQHHYPVNLVYNVIYQMGVVWNADIQNI